MSKAHYEYLHQPGYGRDDHRASELIARAARILGAGSTDAYVAQALGFAPHPVPMGSIAVRLPCERGTKARMIAALRAARREVGHYVDTSIAVVCVRERAGRIEHRYGRKWVPVSMGALPWERGAIGAGR
jgi:hypothetical protein